MDIFGNNNHLRDAVNFFVYDTIKIFILLIVIIFIVSIIRSFLPPEKIRKILSRKDRYAGHILAALLGIVTPFCTCSAIPLFLGFIEAGVPLGVTFTFLVASPMINEVALIMLFGMFGWKVATLYIASGMLIAVVSGLVIGALKPERLLEAIEPKRSGSPLTENVEFKWGDRIKYAKTYVIFIIKKVWLFILIGVGAGAFIHGYVPMDFLAKYAGGDKWYAVPLAALIGIPLYSNAAGIIPLVSALTEKGVAMGTTL
ncbi:MAG: permease, partial [Candidatus Omnitrophota bacterium]